MSIKAPKRVHSARPVIEGLETRRLMSTVYYVSPTGNDSNAGTALNAPWKSLTRVNQQQYFPGDSILFQGGATFSGSLVLPGSDSGTQAQPVTISSYDSGRATISSGTADGIDLVDVNGVNVVNMIVTGTGTNLQKSTGINLMDTQVNAPRLNSIVITGVDVSGYGKAGIGINSQTVTTGFENVVITNCTVHGNGHSGIWSQAGPDVQPAPYGLAHQSIYIGYDTVYDNPGYSGSDASGNGIQLGNANYSTIEHCVAYGNGSANNAKQGGPVGIWTYNSNAVTIQYCQSYSNTTTNLDGDGFDIDGGTTNSVMQYNYSHDNAGIGFLEAQFKGASPQTGNTIRFNISQNDGRKDEECGIMLWAASSSDTIQGSQIYNNTIYMSPATTGTPTGILILSYVVNVAFRNNIIDMGKGLTAITANSTGSGLVFQDNDYWVGGSATNLGIKWGSATYNTLTAFQSGAGQEMLFSTPVGKAVNPQFYITSSTGSPSSSDVLMGSASFILKPSSPMINSGINLAALGIAVGPIDFYYNTLQLNLLPIGAIIN